VEEEAEEPGSSIPAAQEELRKLAESVSIRLPRSALEGALGSIVSGSTIENVMSAARVHSSMIEEARKSIAAAAQSQLRIADFVVPPAFKMAELSATARLVDMAIPESALASWRQGLLLESTAAKIAERWQDQLLPAQAAIAEITRMSSLLPGLSETVLAASIARSWTAAIATDPTRQLRQFLVSLPEPPVVYDLRIGARASQGVAGFAAFDVAVRDDVASDTIERVEIDVLSPWRDGPQAVREGLLRRLEEIDPELANLLIGAWDEAMNAGPAAVVKMTTCAVELIERVLRALAGDIEVRQWYSETGRPKMEIDDNGRPTYAARARYVLEGKQERRLVVSQIDAVVSQVAPLRGIFQGGKHASAGSIASFQSHLLSTEALLMQLLSIR
jgi:hypothetical protein